MTVLFDRPVRRAPLPAPPARPAAAARPRRPFGSARHLDVVLAVLAAAAAGLTRASALGAQAFSDDEGTYTAQAWSVIHHATLSPYTYWYDHPPLGWLVLALWQTLSAPFTGAATSVGVGRVLMVILAALDAALVFVAGRRLRLSRLAAVLAAAAWIASPLALNYSRMVFLDGIGLPLLLGAFVLALTPRRHLWVYAASGLLLAGAALCKETLLLWAPAVLLAAWRGSSGRTRPYCLAALASPALLVLAFYPLLATLKGELLPGRDHVSLFSAVAFQLFGRPSGGSPLVAGTASAVQVSAWLHLDPVLLLAGTAAAGVVLAVRRLHPVSVAVLVPVLVGLRPGYLPDPYVIALLPFCALCLAGSLDVAGKAALSFRRPRLLRAGAALAALAGLLAVVVPAANRWPATTRSLDAGHADQTLSATEAWMAVHVPRHARLLVDDSLWVDLVAQHRPERDVVWFYKTDFTNNLDPSVARTLPGGYRDFDYVVSSPVLRSALAQYPAGLGNAKLALRYSTVLVTLGTGTSRFEVRQVHVPRGAPAPPKPSRQP